jgi:hypothetical protein
MGAAGLAGILVLFAAAQWRWFAAQFYLARLREDSGQLVHLCTAPSSSPAHQAVRQFVSTPQGKDALLRAYLEAMVASGLPPGSFDEIREGSLDWSLFWYHGNQLLNICSKGIPLIYTPELTSRGHTLVLAAVQPLLLEVGYDRHPLPDDPELSFSVLQQEEGGVKILETGDKWRHWPEGHVGLIERARRR